MRSFVLCCLFTIFFVFSTSASCEEITEEHLNKTGCEVVLYSDISDDKWIVFANAFSKINKMDLSNINSLSEEGRIALQKVEITSLNLSGLPLWDQDLSFLAKIKGLESVNLSNTPIGGIGLKYLPSTVKEVTVSNTSVASLSKKALEELKNLIGNSKLTIITH